MLIQTNRKEGREEGQGRGRRECYLVSQSPVCTNSMKQWAQKTKDQIVLSLKKKSASRSNRGELLVYLLIYFRWTVLSSATKWIRFKDSPLCLYRSVSALPSLRVESSQSLPRTECLVCMRTSVSHLNLLPLFFLSSSVMSLQSLPV